MTNSPLVRIARISYRRRRMVVVVWLGLLAALSVLGSTLGGELRNDFSLPGAESEEATDLLDAGGIGDRGGYTGQVVFRADQGVADPSVRSTMEDLFARITAEVPDVAIQSPYEGGGRAQVAPGGHAAFAELRFGDIDLDAATALAGEIADVRAGTDLPAGLDVELGGELFFEEAVPSSEGIGFVAAMVIMLVAFGSVLAMGLPIATALFGIGCGIAVVMLVARVIDIPEFGPQAVMLVAIGVGIDYALLIVTRFRDELHRGLAPEPAVVRAMTTAGRAVFFAGTTVVIALAGLLISGLSVFRSLAVAISAGVLMVMLASLTLLPALLGFAGRSIDRLSVHRRSWRATARRSGPDGATGDGGRDGRRSPWYRWSRVVQRRPAPVAVTATAALVLLAVPVLDMRLGFADAGNRPGSDTARRAYDLISESFGPGYNGPLVLAADLPGDVSEDAAVLDRLSAALDGDEGVALALPPSTNDAGDVGVVQVFPTTSPQDAETFATVDRLRDEVVPRAVAGTSAEVLVGGMTAAAVDFGEVQESQLPVFIVAVLVVSFVLLMAVFRSVLVALKAVVLNMLSIGAAYGAIVALFQWGWGAGVLGLGEPGPVEAWAPMMLFAIVFGLSIDYEVFLLSRIKEEHDRTGDTSSAVADGLAKTARLITAAAAIMVCVTGAFVLSDERAIQLFGLGLAVAIFVDAAVVRTLLVPAAMELLGDRNWWLPRWIDRLLPRIGVDGGRGDREAIGPDDRRPREPEPVG
ncbi:MAG: MMPL family transporter [Acidimicrobiia bacterium]